MGRMAMAGLMAAALAGCTVQAETTTTPAGGGENVLAAFGSPLLAIAKVPVCVVTIVMAAPVGAVSELSDPATPFGHDLRQGLSDGIAQNCGPPYVVAP
jgi:hypothetical protein